LFIGILENAGFHPANIVIASNDSTAGAEIGDPVRGARQKPKKHESF